jgi:hypothetical protein
MDPIFTADRNERLHLEARYNYENLETGSLWMGYDFSVGHKLVLNATPMLGGVFGRSAGIAPGYEISLTYKRLSFAPRENMCSIPQIIRKASSTTGRR